MKEQVFEQCQRALPKWRDRAIDAFDFEDPKGFSSFTMSVRSKLGDTDPPAVLYRRLEGKENAILDFDREREVFLLLGEHRIAARCHHYDEAYRIEEFYDGRTLEPESLFDAAILEGIAGELARFHRLEPENLPEGTFFELLHAKWGATAKRVLEEMVDVFPPEERALCDELRAIYSDETFEKVQRCLPDGPTMFCHNDTYHGNVMRLDDGRIKLLDFEFSCLNHRAYDFSNLFAETVMEHKLPEYPYFRIAEPRYTTRDIATLVGFYFDHFEFASTGQRDAAEQRLVRETEDMIMMSDYMYAMAALPLAVHPIQKIRFIPYAHQRFSRFLAAVERRSGAHHANGAARR